jgi:hypothetical protein
MSDISLLFNISIVLIGLSGLIIQNIKTIQLLNKLSCIITFIYFPYDTYFEFIHYKRYTFIPHHIICVILGYKVYFLTDIYFIKNSPILLVCSEGTSLIVNVRTLLKNKNKLTTTTDISLLILYTYIRNCIITPILYNIPEKYKFVWYLWFPILVMSNIWCYLWLINIIKYYNKNKRLNSY